MTVDRQPQTVSLIAIDHGLWTINYGPLTILLRTISLLIAPSPGGATVVKRIDAALGRSEF